MWMNLWANPGVLAYIYNAWLQSVFNIKGHTCDVAQAAKHEIQLLDFDWNYQVVVRSKGNPVRGQLVEKDLRLLLPVEV